MQTVISKPPLIARMRSRPVPTVIGVVALVLAAVCGVLAWTMSGGTASQVVDTHEVVNTAGKYRFEAPEGWSTTQQDRTTTVTSPDQETVITLGVGRVGSLPVVGTLFFQQVASNYKNVKVIPPEAKNVGSRSALIYGGVGDNPKNSKIRFLAITVEGKPSNYAITVFTAADSDPTTVLPPVNRVVDTFRSTT